MRQAVLAALLLVGSAARALALSDEIQVYTGDVAAPGVFNLTWHNNYTFDGLKTPDFPAGLTDNRSLSGVTEWAYGVTPWTAWSWKPAGSGHRSGGWRHSRWQPWRRSG